MREVLYCLKYRSILKILALYGAIKCTVKYPHIWYVNVCYVNGSDGYQSMKCRSLSGLVAERQATIIPLSENGHDV